MTDQEDGDVRRRIVGRVAVVVVAAGVADRPDAKIAVEQAAVAAVRAVPREATPDARQQRAAFLGERLGPNGQGVRNAGRSRSALVKRSGVHWSAPRRKMPCEKGQQARTPWPNASRRWQIR